MTSTSLETCMPRMPSMPIYHSYMVRLKILVFSLVFALVNLQPLSHPLFAMPVNAIDTERPKARFDQGRRNNQAHKSTESDLEARL